MGTLGAVYGISFVVGSLASMGSAYMASNIYKIEDEALVEVPMEAGMYGGVDPITNPMYKRPINYEIAVRKAESDKAKAQAEAEAEAEAQAKAQTEEKRNLRRKMEEKSKEIAEAELKAKEEDEAKAKIEEEARIKAEAEAKAKIEEEARIKAEAEAEAKKLAQEEANKRYQEASKEERINIRKNWGLEDFQRAKELSDKKEAEARIEAERLSKQAEREAEDEKAEAERLLTQAKIKEEAEEAERLLTQAKIKAEAERLKNRTVKEKINDWINTLKKNEAINNSIGKYYINEFLNSNKDISPSQFLNDYVLIVQSNINPAIPPVPYLSPDSIEIFIQDPSLNPAPVPALSLAPVPTPPTPGGQRGGSMNDFQIFDIVRAIENTRSSKSIYDIIENGPFGNDGNSIITFENLEKLKPYIIAFHSNITFPDSQSEFNEEIGNINKRRKAKILTVTSWLRKVPSKTNITEKDIIDIVPDSLSLKQFIDILSNMNDDDKKKLIIQINKKTFTKATGVILPSYVLDDTIKILTDELDDKIEIKDLIKYFQSNGTVYTFFKFKNLLRLMYDYTLGDIDKVIIHLSRVMKWLNEIKNSNRITNKEIETFIKPNPAKVNILVDTLYFLIKQRVLIKTKLIRVSDFNAIETLDPTNVDRNTKIISWLIDPAVATLPKPTKEQYTEFIKQLQLPKIEKDMMKVPTLFVGPVVLPDFDSTTEGTSTTQPTEYIRGVDLLQKIEGTIENRGKAIKKFGETVQGYEKTEREKKSKEFMSKTEKAEKEKLIKDVTEKDKKIKDLEEAEKKLKTQYDELMKNDAIKAAAKKIFDEKLKKAVEAKSVTDMEKLLKQQNADLATEYDKIKKEMENKNKGLIKPLNLDQSIWDKLLSEIGAIKDPLKLAEYTNKFKTDNPTIDVTPFPDIEKMINAIYSAKQSKENKEKGNNSNSNLKICKNAKVGDKCRDQDNNFNVITKTGGYRQTLRNHLRSNRSSTRRYV